MLLYADHGPSLRSVYASGQKWRLVSYLVYKIMHGLQLCSGTLSSSPSSSSALVSLFAPHPGRRLGLALSIFSLRRTCCAVELKISQTSTSRSGRKPPSECSLDRRLLKASARSDGLDRLAIQSSILGLGRICHPLGLPVARVAAERAAENVNPDRGGRRGGRRRAWLMESFSTSPHCCTR